ncbi:hypothetical protein FGO68_gene8460 [Halteria grandinella]|uniref:Uncharacterized protein n=1 Tax=Halteria grandinella TaxID=5974 RepID=A0A8J8SX94_HALGN|nr:hypothetical protein FGO68_gene8460 [Halteria grandinella]
MYIEEQTCRKCNSLCATCILGSAYNCTSCPRGYYLKILHSSAQTGMCKSLSEYSYKEFAILVHGNRSISSSKTLLKAGGLTDALQMAAELALNSSGVNVTIYLDPNVIHYITFNDTAFASPMHLKTHMPFSLNILPLGCIIQDSNPCPQKATIINKVGAAFTISVPEQGFVFRDIIFDGIDSVIDFTNTTDDMLCSISYNKTCCRVDENFGNVSCESVNNNTIKLKPVFNKFQQCFFRNNKGLFSVVHNDLRYQRKNETRRVQIQVSFILQQQSAYSFVSLKTCFMSQIRLCEWLQEHSSIFSTHQI